MKSTVSLQAVLLAGALFWPMGCGQQPANPPAPGNGTARAPEGDQQRQQRQPSAMQDPNQSPEQESAEQPKPTIDTAAQRGIEYLMGRYGQPVTEGGWGPESPLHGYNGLVVNALLRTIRPMPATDERITATIDALIGGQAADGAWVSKDLGEAVYETSVVMRALIAAAKSSEEMKNRSDLADAVRKGREYLLKTQADEMPEVEGDYKIDSTNPNYGGFTYGRLAKRGFEPYANLSTTHFAMAAIEESAYVAPIEDDSLKQAREKLHQFLKMCHNLHEYGGTAYNNSPIENTVDGDGARIVPGNDGGAIYAPGVSAAGAEIQQDGTRIPRSYGSMTYALMRLYHMVGLPADDPRIRAAYVWVIRAENFTFERNPGLPASIDGNQYQGHYYYLYTAASTLAVLAESQQITDSKGQTHDWRQELGAVLIRLQNDNGAWVNAHDARWQEHSPLVATSFALIALGHLK